MTARNVFTTLDRLSHRTPSNLATAVRLVTQGALDNARRAAEEITTAVNERRLLTRSQDLPAAGDLARLTPTECRALLATRSIGRLAYIARTGVPDIVPVNYVMDGQALVVRSAPGPKLQAAERREIVAFEVDDIDEISHTGWSVVVVGPASRVPVEDTAHPGGPRPTPWASGPRRHTIRIEPRRIDGRRLL